MVQMKRQNLSVLYTTLRPAGICLCVPDSPPSFKKCWNQGFKNGMGHSEKLLELFPQSVPENVWRVIFRRCPSEEFCFWWEVGRRDLQSQDYIIPVFMKFHPELICFWSYFSQTAVAWCQNHNVLKLVTFCLFLNSHNSVQRVTISFRPTNCQFFGPGKE